MSAFDLSFFRRITRTPEQRLQLLLGSLLLFLTLCIAVIAGSQIYQSNSAQAQSFGHTLARLTAEASTGLLVTDDRVSMNVLLGRLLDNPYVVSATIYGVDGEVLAQARPLQAPPAFSQAFSAPIHYQEVIAAYVRLELNGFYLDRPVSRTLLQILFTSLAFMALGSWLLRRHTHALLQAPCMPEVVVAAQTSPIEQDALPAEGTDAPDSAHVVIAIHSQNLAKLSRCLQPREVQQLLDTQLTALKAGADLYGGHLSYSAEGNSFISFAESDQSDYRFRAICCTLLLRILLSEVPVNAPARLHFGFGLALAEEEQPLWPEQSHPAQSRCASSEALGLACHTELDGISMSQHLNGQLTPALQEQLETTPSDGGAELLALHGHYATLLERQLTHLLAQLSGQATEEPNAPRL